ncbi:unnamed protein product, partial [Dovyalis caffra]
LTCEGLLEAKKLGDGRIGAYWSKTVGKCNSGLAEESKCEGVVEGGHAQLSANGNSYSKIHGIDKDGPATATQPTGLKPMLWRCSGFGLGEGHRLAT